MEAGKDAYYQMMGFDREGIPTEAALAELGLDWLGPRIGKNV